MSHFETGVHVVDDLPVAYRHLPAPSPAPRVLFLHGGLSDGRVFDPLVAALLATTAPDRGYDVWTVDRRGHGATPDTAEPFGFDDMSAEAVAVIEGLVGAPVHLVGHSDGASLALLIAARRPDLVASVSAFSGNTDPSGAGEGAVTVADMVAAVAPTYAEVSPDGVDHVAVVAAKALHLWATEPRIAPDLLARIACPVLVASGEHDSIREAHTRSIAAAVPHARLAILPGTTHMLVTEQPDVCAALVAGTVDAADAAGEHG